MSHGDARTKARRATNGTEVALYRKTIITGNTHDHSSETTNTAASRAGTPDSRRILKHHMECDS